jgi:TolB-like protein/Tfp pilus assembly protein PilF
MAEDQAPEFPATSGRDVFISYASQDKAVADAVCEALERNGLRCWIAPRDVTPGEFYAESIVHAIDSTKVIVLVLSEHSADSQHVLREVERASSKRHPVVSFRLDSAPLPAGLEYFLNSSQWLDASTTGVAGSLHRLVDAVKTALSQPVTSPRTSAASPAITRSSGRGRPVFIALAILTSTALAYLAVSKFWLPKPAPAPSPVTSLAAPTAAVSAKSIAVLPLTNESGDPSQQYFSDGLSENLITALTQFPGLKVIGRTSAFQFRDSREDAHSIGAKLGVARLLEGSVQRSGETVRVSAELIDTADGSTQWSDRYDRPYKDLFALQDDITRAVATALRAKLLPGQNAQAENERPPSGSLEAYNALLQGRFYESRGAEPDNRKAIEFYTQATRLDPHYALAWAELSLAWIDHNNVFAESAQAKPATFAKAREAAERALALSPNLAAAHIARGYLVSSFNLDWAGAEVEYRRAVELAPNSGAAKDFLARLLAAFGEVEQAITLVRQALIVEPLRDDYYFDLAAYLSGLKQLDEAKRAIRRAIELQPAGAIYHWQLAVIEIQRGDAQAALDAAQQEAQGSTQRDIGIALARQIGDDRAAADAALRTLIDKQANRSAYEIAEVYALRNEPGRVFEWLDRAWTNREADISYLLYDPFILRFKDDPRFAAFCRKVGLPVPGEKGKAI